MLLMSKSTISMAIVNSYVSLPEGKCHAFSSHPCLMTRELILFTLHRVISALITWISKMYDGYV